MTPEPRRAFEAAGDRRRASARRSLRVASLKLLLPLAALVIVAIAFAWPQLGGDQVPRRIDRLATSGEDRDTLRMLNATFVSEDGEKRPFTVIARQATQSSEAESKVDLVQPKADLVLEDGTWVAIHADAGVFDRVDRSLALAGDVRLFHDSGAEVRTPSAFVELDDGRATGREPVTAISPSGRIDGEGFDVVDRGRVIFVHGRAKAVLHPTARGEPGPRAAADRP
jgi:lipopolysaccharide export system protein LptC